MAVARGRLGRAAECFARSIECGLQLHPRGEALAVDFVAECQRVDVEVGSRGVAVDEEWSGALTENTRTLTGHFAAITVVQHGGQRHCRGQIARRLAV